MLHYLLDHFARPLARLLTLLRTLLLTLLLALLRALLLLTLLLTLLLAILEAFGLDDDKDERQLAEELAMAHEREGIQRGLHATLARVESGLLHSLPAPLHKALELLLAGRRAWREAKAQAVEDERLRLEKEAKRQTKSLMRQKSTKYGQLNAWEAHSMQI